MKKKILLIGNFSNSHKHSMKCYENDLYLNLKKTNTEFAFELYQPEPWFKKNSKLKTLLQYIIEISNKKKIDLYHITDHSLLFIAPFLKKKIITTVHDIIPILNEKEIGQKKSFYYKNFNFFLKKNTCIIARSETTKKNLINLFNFNSNNIKVIYPGISDVFKIIKKNRNSLFKKYSLSQYNKKILIFLNPFYKNNLFSLEIIKKYEENYKEELDLIFIGQPYDLFKLKLKEYSFKSNCYYFSNLQENSVNEIYNLCDCLLFPSINEGFGAPPIEAMKVGVPVMCSKIKIFKETIGSLYPLYELDVSIFVKNLRDILHNFKVKEKMINDGFRISNKYKIDIHTENHSNFYKTVIK